MIKKIVQVRICRPKTDSWLTLEYECGLERPSAGLLEELVEHDFPGWKFVCHTIVGEEDNAS
jgi:hypothetical protein